MKYIFVSCTSKDSESSLFFNNYFNHVIVNKGDNEIALHMYPYNTKGLSENYNDALTRFKDIYDVIVFIHDDVIISDSLFFHKLNMMFKTWDVIGVAGSSSATTKGDMICWHHSPKESWSGGCFHAMKDKCLKNDFSNIHEITYTHFGEFGKRCAVLDGLFIAVKTSSITPKIVWDNDLTFDMYDFDFTLNCTINKLKVTTCPVSIIHNSYGKGLMSDRYIRLQNIFKEKWLKKKLS